MRARGQVWVRVGSRRAIAAAQDERILNERHRHLDAPFDARPVSRATLADLDVRRFEKDYLPQACGPELLAANIRTTEERIAATRMIASVDEPVPTVVAMLVFERSPRDFIPKRKSSSCGWAPSSLRRSAAKRAAGTLLR